jgi:hypothetical protein
MVLLCTRDGGRVEQVGRELMERLSDNRRDHREHGQPGDDRDR